MLAANLVAIPYVSWLIVPLCLLATLLHAVLPWAEPWLWWLAAKLLQPLWWWLRLLAGLPGAVWWHPVTALQCLWLTLATAWWLAPRGWPLRSLAGLLLLPVLWPATTPLPRRAVYLPQSPRQTVVVLREGRNLVLLVQAPRPRTRLSLSHWCEGAYRCGAPLEMTALWTPWRWHGFKLRWQQDWLVIERAKQRLLVLPAATEARVERLLRYAGPSPDVVIFATKRSACAALARQLHRGWPRSAILSKTCPGGAWLPVEGLVDAVKQVPLGFYSTARNGSITIPVS